MSRARRFASQVVLELPGRSPRKYKTLRNNVNSNLLII